MTNLNVPSPHNRAKQVLCIAKLHMKIANGFLTRAGAERFAQMREGVHQTPQAGRSILDALRQAPDAPGPQPDPVLPDPDERDFLGLIYLTPQSAYLVHGS